MSTFVTFNIYLFYGLVFFSIGCVVLFRNFKYSQLSISTTLWALALFGFSHAFHEWSELYVILFEDQITAKYETLIQWLTLIKLSLSFTGLLIFAWLLLGKSQKWIAKIGQWCVVVILVSYSLGMLIFISNTHIPVDSFAEARTYTRWLLGFGSASLAAVGVVLYGLYLQQSEHNYGRYFIATGFGLFIYGILAGIVPTDLHHSVPVFRTLAATLILVTLYKALKIFDIERELVTEAKLKRAVEADKYKAIGHLAMGIAHEINNPLASSSLALEILERKYSANVGADEYIERVRHGISRASEISKELLSYTRSDSSTFKLVKFNEILSSALKLLSHKVQQFNVISHCQQDITFYGQAVKLEELVINLVNNAMDASELNSEIVITIKADKEQINLIIEDHGEGMDKTTLSRATELFYSTKAIGKGTGLGLAICEQIVSAHQGEMRIESQLGVGTSVFVTFTRIKIDDKGINCRR